MNEPISTQDANRKDNVKYVVEELLIDPKRSRKEIADAIGTDEATVGRWLKAGNVPSTDPARRLAKRTSIEENDLNMMALVDFKRKYPAINWMGRSKNQAEASDRAILGYGLIPDSIQKNEYLFARHRGWHFLYTREQTTTPATRSMNKHLLHIHHCSKQGVEFVIHRQYEIGVWNEYHGLIFEVGDFLHFLGEDVVGHDMMMMVTTRLKKREKGQMAHGRMISVRRSGENSRPSAWQVALVYLADRANRDNFHEELRERSDISKFTEAEQITIRPVFA